MSVPIIWICRKCGYKTSSTKKPSTNGVGYPKCPRSSTGKHDWVEK